MCSVSSGSGGQAEESDKAAGSWLWPHLSPPSSLDVCRGTTEFYSLGDSLAYSGSTFLPRVDECPSGESSAFVDSLNDTDDSYELPACAWEGSGNGAAIISPRSPCEVDRVWDSRIRENWLKFGQIRKEIAHEERGQAEIREKSWASEAELISNLVTKRVEVELQTSEVDSMLKELDEALGSEYVLQTCRGQMEAALEELQREALAYRKARNCSQENILLSDLTKHMRCSSIENAPSHAELRALRYQVRAFRRIASSGRDAEAASERHWLQAEQARSRAAIVSMWASAQLTESRCEARSLRAASASAAENASHLGLALSKSKCNVHQVHHQVCELEMSAESDRRAMRSEVQEQEADQATEDRGLRIAALCRAFHSARQRRKAQLLSEWRSRAAVSRCATSLGNSASSGASRAHGLTSRDEALRKLQYAEAETVRRATELREALREAEMGVSDDRAMLSMLVDTTAHEVDTETALATTESQELNTLDQRLAILQAIEFVSAQYVKATLESRRIFAIAAALRRPVGRVIGVAWLQWHVWVDSHARGVADGPSLDAHHRVDIDLATFGPALEIEALRELACMLPQFRFRLQRCSLVAWASAVAAAIAVRRGTFRSMTQL